MRRKSVLFSIVLATLLITAAKTLRSQNAAPSSWDADRAKHLLAINVLRNLNMAELEYKNSHGMYAAKDVLLASEMFRGRWSPKIESMAKAPISSGPEILPGWALRLNITADGQSYDLLLEDKTDTSCGYAAVTDERGVIRQSKAIDCAI